MRSKFGRSLLIAIVLLLGGGLLSGVSANAAAAGQSIGSDDQVTTGGFRPAPISWHACPQDPTDASFRCAALTLPIDWAHPFGATFSLALAEHLATDPSQRIGPLLVNPGGPGGSGVDFVLDDAAFFSANLRARFDVIGFDPRGVGLSDPIECSTSLLTESLFPVPATEADYDAIRAYNAALAADCRAHTGPIFDHVDTLSVVRDMDAIRAALGEHQLSYYGVSYGTLIGQEYAENFPNRIRALVIDSNMDHSLSTLPFLLTTSANDEDSFEQFVAWCDRDTTCVLHGQDVNAIWDNLMRRAAAGMLTIPGTTTPVSWFLLSEVAVSLAYGPSWAREAMVIQELNAETGSVTTASAADTTDVSPDPMPIFCEDWSLPVHSFQQLRQYFAATNALAPHLRTSAIGWSSFIGCLGWPGPVNDPQKPLRAFSPEPLLEINSLHDPATAYAWAVDDARQLGPDVRFVTYLGWGHGAYPHSSCTTGTVDAYLLDLTLPTYGATCPAVPPPDQTTPAFGPLTVGGTPTFGL